MSDRDRPVAYVCRECGVLAELRLDGRTPACAEHPLAGALAVIVARVTGEMIERALAAWPAYSFIANGTRPINEPQRKRRRALLEILLRAALEVPMASEVEAPCAALGCRPRRGLWAVNRAEG